MVRSRGNLVVLSLSLDKDDRVTAARSLDITVPLQALLACDKDAVVRSVVASNRVTDPKILSFLSRDRDIFFLRKLVENEGVSTHEACKVRSKLSDVGGVLLSEDNSFCSVMDNCCATGTEILNLDKMLTSLGYSGVTPEILNLLSRDDSISLRSALARHPMATAEVFSRLVCDEESAVRHSIAINPSATGSALAFLSQDADPVVRAAVAAHTNTPERSLKMLICDSDVRVRWAVTTNLAVTQSMLEELSFDTESYVRCMVASNILVSSDVLFRLSDDPDELVRCSVVVNPSAPVSLLRKLSHDTSVFVCIAASSVLFE